MPAGLGGGGWLAIKHETTMGTYLPPTTSGTVWVPILDESFVYTEDKYFSPQIRQQTIVSDVQQAPYHIEGDIHMEVDPNFLPYFMYCARHIITKDAVTHTPQTLYSFSPGSQGSASTAASGAVPRTASITIVRNGIGFGYAGCVMGGYEFTIDNGVLMVTFNAFGLSEATPGGLGSPAWIDPVLFGAASHAVYVDTAGTGPTFASADLNFNGYTFNSSFNAAAQNRLTPSRAATYISYGETEATYSTELDFVDKTEYTNMVAATKRAVRLESLKGGATWALATSGVRIDVNNSVYNTYTVNLAGMADLIMATVEGRAIGIAGGNAYTVTCSFVSGHYLAVTNKGDNMPKATVNADGTKVDLRTCPGGFVTLRQLSFGQMLKRRDMAAKYMQEFGTGRDTTNRITIDILNEASRKYDFAHCIIDHNLEDDSGNKLDFSNAMSLDILDPKIAAEIENEIDKLNLTDFDSENFTTQSESSSTVTGNGSQKEEDSVPLKTT